LQAQSLKTLTKRPGDKSFLNKFIATRSILQYISNNMGKQERLIRAILDGLSDRNINFRDLCKLLEYLGFVENISGSHHIFRKEGILERINLQQDGTKAKAYQVKQVRNILIKYKLGPR
jgi:hypothetical protein